MTQAEKNELVAQLRSVVDPADTEEWNRIFRGQPLLRDCAPPVIRLIEAFLAQWPDEAVGSITDRLIADELKSEYLQCLVGSFRGLDTSGSNAQVILALIAVLYLIPEAERVRQVREWCGEDETLDEETQVPKTRVVWSGDEFDGAIGR